MVKEGQNIFDVCLEKYGSIEFVFNLLIENKWKLSTNLSSGQEVNVDNDVTGNRNIKDYYRLRNIAPVNYMNAVRAVNTTNSPYTADSTKITADTTEITADATGATKTVYIYNSNDTLGNFIILIENKTETISDDQTRDGQNIFDVTLQKFGNIEFVFSVIQENNMNLNTNLQSGIKLNASNQGKGNQEVKDYYKRKSIIPVNGNN